MTMEKRGFSKNSIEPINEPLNFLKGDRFMAGERIWVVTEVINDGNTEMRRMSSNKGDDEILLLNSLRKYPTDENINFKMLDPEKLLQDNESEE